MHGNSPARSADSRGPPSAASPPRWARRWLLAVLLGLLVGATAVLAWKYQGWFGSTTTPTLDGELIVAVRPVGRAKDSLRVDEAGALPVRPDGWMSAEVHFNQPAFAYIVWFDCEGRVIPLYPWNNETLDVTDVN